MRSEYFVRYLRVSEKQLPQHLVFTEAQISARWQHFRQELLHHRLRHPALLSCQHFGLEIWGENQPISFCVKSKLEHQHLPLFPQLVLWTTRGALNCISTFRQINTWLNEPHQLFVHQRLVTVDAVELVLENNLWQGVIEELPGEQCHQVLQRGFDVSRSLKKQMTWLLHPLWDVSI